MATWKAALAAPIMIAALMAPAQADGNLDRFKPAPFPQAPKPGPDFTKPMPTPTPAPQPDHWVRPLPVPGNPGAIGGGRFGGTTYQWRWQERTGPEVGVQKEWRF